MIYVLLLITKVHAFWAATWLCHVWYQIEAIIKYKGYTTIYNINVAEMVCSCYSLYSFSAAKVCFNNSCIRLTLWHNQMNLVYFWIQSMDHKDFACQIGLIYLFYSIYSLLPFSIMKTYKHNDRHNVHARMRQWKLSLLKSTSPLKPMSTQCIIQQACSMAYGLIWPLKQHTCDMVMDAKA